MPIPIVQRSLPRRPSEQSWCKKSIRRRMPRYAWRPEQVAATGIRFGGNVNDHMATVNAKRRVCKCLDPEGSGGWRAPYRNHRRPHRRARSRSAHRRLARGAARGDRIASSRSRRRAPVWRRCSACVTAARCPSVSTRRSGRRPVCPRSARAVAGGRFELTIDL